MSTFVNCESRFSRLRPDQATNRAAGTKAFPGPCPSGPPRYRPQHAYRKSRSASHCVVFLDPEDVRGRDPLEGHLRGT